MYGAVRDQNRNDYLVQKKISFVCGVTTEGHMTPLHNVHFVKYDVTVSFMAQVLDTVAYFVSHVLVVDTVTYFDIFR